MTVVELCQNVAGPYAGLILGQLGARVVKVERPGRGDDTRGWGPPFVDGQSVMFEVMNAGKDSVALDLKDPDDRGQLVALVAGADVVVQSWRPGALAALGLDYESLTANHPELVYCSISGFGPTGPLADAPGYDPLIQAFCGLMSVTGVDGTPPVRIGTSIVDMGAGLWAVIGILAALQDRVRTGRGQHVTASLLETGLAWLPYQMGGYLATGDEPSRMGSGLPMLVPYQAFATADRYLVLAAGNDGLWRRLCRALDREDLAQDGALATNAQRVAARDHVVSELETTLCRQPAAVWEAALREAGVPCSIVQSVAEAAEHPQTQALGLLGSGADAAREAPTPALPIWLDGERLRARRPAPRLGEHSSAVAMDGGAAAASRP